jgi:outer membrane receptor for ferrienterochelin and colicin
MRSTIRGVGFLLVGLLIPAHLLAQTQVTNAGRITGRVVNAETGRPVERAQVELIGTSQRALTDMDGRYFLQNVPPGTHVVDVRQIGFTFKTVTNVTVTAGETTVLDVSLGSAVFTAETITVSAEIEQGTVGRALEEQRTALNIVNAISAEQIARSPDSDASEAVQRVSGVTVQDGKYVFVRGLGERYTTTSLNGSRLPSPEPEKRMVPLDLFPAGLLETVSTSKTFTPDQPGDFSGGSVDIRTRDFPASRVLALSLGTGFNANATGATLPTAQRVGSEWLGFPGTARALPAGAAAGGDLSGLTQEETNQILRSFRNAWTPEAASGLPKGSFGVTVGGGGTGLGYIASLTYRLDQELRRREERAQAIADGQGGALPQNTYVGETGRRSVLWGGILNLSTKLGGGTSRLQLSNTYNRTADNEAISLQGESEEFGLPFAVSRMSFVARSVWSSQLRGEHLLGGRHRVDWLGSYSRVTRDEPDRSDIVYETAADPNDSTVRVPVRWWGAPRSATRTFSALREWSGQGGASLRLAFGGPSHETAVKLGGEYRRTSRDADSRAYDLLNFALDEAQRAAPAEELFDGRYFDGQIGLRVNQNGGQYAAAEDYVAGYMQAELPLGRRIRIIGGARLERDRLTVQSLQPSGADTTATLDDLDLLPSLGLTVSLSRNSNLRFAATQTLSRPEYRELSPTTSFEPLGGLTLEGNPELRRALIQNADLRWEAFPAPGEVVSVGVFAKRFDDPIEQVIVAGTGANRLSWVNTEAAYNYGAELELRASLGRLAGALLPLTAFGNLTLMQSEIDVGAQNQAALTNTKRPMVGQAEYVVNTGLAYSNATGSVAATLLYNLVGPRIVEAGVNPLPDTYEQSRHILDVSLQFPAFGGVSVKLDAENLLDQRYLRTQGAVTRLRYYTGRTFSLGLSWSPGR